MNKKKKIIKLDNLFIFVQVQKGTKLYLFKWNFLSFLPKNTFMEGLSRILKKEKEKKNGYTR